MSLFGSMPFPVQFFLAFVIVLGLIGATAWAVRRFGAGALSATGLRGRQPRLAVLEHTLVEGRRRLYLVRRDNVEHLLLIGGPTDIVVEPSIVRAVAPSRDVGVVRPPAVESLPRAIPLPDNAGSWPLQPEPAAAPSPPPRQRSEPVHEEPSWPLQPHADAAPARSQRDTLAALADELTPPARPAPSRNRPPNGRVYPPEPRPAPVQYSAPEAAEDADQNLAEMAHRLEAALRKPTPKADAREPRAPAPIPRAAAPEPVEEDEPAPIAAPPRIARTLEPKPTRPETKTANPGKALYDSLEQEMASLLGRPAGKQH